MKRRIFIFMAAIIAILLSGACGKADEETGFRAWEPAIENLQWGMQEQEIEMFYSYGVEEEREGILRIALENPIEIWGVSMNVVLTVDDLLGLIRVTGMAGEEGYDKLEQKLQEELSGYRTGSQPTDGASWKSEAADEKYEKEALMRAYAKVFGEGVIGDNYLDGILAGPQVFYELKKMRQGCRLVIDATVKQELEYITNAG